MGEDRSRLPDMAGLPADLLDVARRYAAQPVPRPTPEQTRRLVDRMLAEAAHVQPGGAPHSKPVHAAMRVARWRVRLISVWFWIVCVLLLPVVGGVARLNPEAGRIAPLILLLPLTAVLGLAQASRTPSRGLRAVETACPIGRGTVVAAAALAIVALDCAFGVIATGLLALLSWAPFVTLLVAWLGPLLLLAALSLPVALRWGAVPAATVGSGPWLALALIAAIWPSGPAVVFFTLPHDVLSFTLHIVAAVLGVAVLLLFLRGSAWQRVFVKAVI